MIAQEDCVLAQWIGGILKGKPRPAGGFLTALADAVMRADGENYALLRAALWMLREKYPDYHDPES